MCYMPSRPQSESLEERMNKEMKHAAMELQFERAAELRDKILELKKHM